MNELVYPQTAAFRDKQICICHRSRQLLFGSDKGSRNFCIPHFFWTCGLSLWASDLFHMLAHYLGRDPFNQNFRKFRFKTQWIGLVQPEKFRKNGSTFRGGPLFPVGSVGILVEWIAPLVSKIVSVEHCGFKVSSLDTTYT